MLSNFNHEQYQDNNYIIQATLLQSISSNNHTNMWTTVRQIKS